MCSSRRHMRNTLPRWREACGAVYLATSFLLALAALGASVTDAAQIVWPTKNFSYLAQNKPLKEFLREFAASQGVALVIDSKVEGTVNGKFNLTPQSLLDLMATSFGLMWYYDGSILYIYPAGAMSSAVIQLGTATVGELQASLQRLDIVDDRYPIAYDLKQNTVRVSGPTRYVDLVRQAARAIDQNELSRGAAEIKVFPLRYAWAADFTFMQGGRERRLPGVASVLRDLYSPNRTKKSAPPATSSRQERLERMRGLGMFRDEEVEQQDPEQVAPVEQELTPLPMSGSELPQFQADGRLNAVVVRDRPERMAFYEAVVRALDVKPGLVEIEARILEISADAVDSLGIDWRLHSPNVDLQFSRGNLPNLGYETAIDERSPRSSPVPLPPGAGGNGLVPLPGAGIVPPVPSQNFQTGGILTTVLGDSGRYLIARVNALAQDGKANVLSSPRVLTLDNVEAVVENISTFFVRVAGNLDVALFNVSAGTSLRVTPLIVSENGHTQVKMAIRIEDGSISGRAVDQIPVVQRSTIGTQAFINEGESLLIGGYENNAESNSEVGVPWLSSVPVLGRLFKYTEKRTTRVQRLFLLTPRVIEPPAAKP